MTALKRLGFLSFSILTACAPPKTFDHTENMQPAIQSEKQLPDDNSKQQVSAEHATVPSSWELSGAMAARNKTKAYTASVNWLQRGSSSYQIRLSGPLGSGTVLIDKQNGLVTFRDGPKSASSKNADELLQKQTGIRLPVNNLYYWVRGIPAPGPVQSAKRSAANQLLLLQQAGFTIEYPSYSKIGNSVLPSIIKLQGNGVAIKFVIKRWKV